MRGTSMRRTMVLLPRRLQAVPAMRLRIVRWLVPLGLVMLLLPGCGTGDGAETTAATAATVAETVTTAPTATTTSPTTTVALEGLGPFEVAMSVVSHETTRDISVWAPEGDGSWPVVYLISAAGSGQDLAEMATRLASRGTVVFAPDDRRNDSIFKQEQDLECGYRYTWSVAAEYGGDLDLPVTMIGDSYGAMFALAYGVGETYYGPGGEYDVCLEGVPRPDVVVPIAGCYYEFQGGSVRPLIDLMVDKVAEVKLDGDLAFVVGDADEICQAWQSEDAVETLQAAGYNARLVVIPGGDHGNVVFWAEIDGEWVTAPNEPVGQLVVQIILDAIDAAQP